MAWLNDRRPKLTADRLAPVIVQDAESGEVLMLAWANGQALAATERTHEAHFWSRSRNALWRKGETSGNVMRVVDLATDCDGDALRYRVIPSGPACHTGSRSCFAVETDAAAPSVFTLRALSRLVEARAGADPERSNTARLLADGPRRPAEKVVEEAGEVLGAALSGDDDELRGEAADLLYHLLVALTARGISLEQVEATLAARRKG
ncbi:MAG: bifunctional phosphoribosyl-AMP cyclohydrolase/phosphoribosyl-ATP diphosphatase HisIE [Chloroflexota bacterium]